MRSPAKPQVVFAVESHMDMIAQELGMDAYQFRLKNVMREGDSSPIGHHWQQIKALETLEAAAKAAGIDKQLPLNTGRGMAMTDLVQPIARVAAAGVLGVMHGRMAAFQVHFTVVDHVCDASTQVRPVHDLSMPFGMPSPSLSGSQRSPRPSKSKLR